MRSKKTLILLLMWLFLAGCSKSNLAIKLVSDGGLNIDEQGASLPTQVVFYQLRSKDKFLRASFVDLWLHDQEVLGDDFLAKKEINLLPNSSSQVHLKLNKDCHYLGAVVLLIRPGKNNWRAITKVLTGEAVFSLPVTISINNDRVEIK